MTTWVAFLRGINVGGANILLMKDLTSSLEKSGLFSVRTYIQSGNIVFQSPEIDASPLAKRMRTSILERHGLEPRVLLLKASELEHAAASNPFPQAEANPKSLHLYFLAELPLNPNLEALHRVQSSKESFVLDGRVFYLHAPDGIGRSKLAEQAERRLGVDATARNWNTVCKVLDMVRRLE
jgi:uncharacterized protein (DUF1697 family)